jgi:hypothetical protein
MLSRPDRFFTLTSSRDSTILRPTQPQPSIVRRAIARNSCSKDLTSFLLDRACISCRGEQEAAALAFDSPDIDTISTDAFRLLLLKVSGLPFITSVRNPSDLKFPTLASWPIHQSLAVSSNSVSTNRFNHDACVVISGAISISICITSNNKPKGEFEIPGFREVSSHWHEVCGSHIPQTTPTIEHLKGRMLMKCGVTVVRYRHIATKYSSGRPTTPWA